MTSVADSDEDSHQVVAMSWKERSAMSKLLPTRKKEEEEEQEDEWRRRGRRRGGRRKGEWEGGGKGTEE